MKKNKMNIIAISFSFAIILMCIGFLSIDSTYSASKPITFENSAWNVSFGDLQNITFSDGVEQTDLSRKNDGITFKLKLGNFGDEYSFTSNIRNDGAYDARLTSLTLSNLSEIIYGYSDITEKNYSLSDFVNFDVVYARNSNDEKLIVNNPLKIGDILASNSSIPLLVSIKFKDKKELTSDQIYVLENNNNIINLDIAISANYSQV